MIVLVNITRSSLLHPILISIFPVLFLFSVNQNELDFQDIVLPSIIYVSTAFAIWIVLGSILKNRRKSALIVSLGLIIFFSYGHTINLLQEIPILWDLTGNHIPLRSLMIVYGIIFVTGIVLLLKAKKTFDNATIIVNVIAIVIISSLIFNIVSYEITNEVSSSRELNDDSNFVNFDVTNKPDIYHIILDGYGREDILKSYYNYDNSDFINSLNERGLIVSSKSNSNYFSTFLSITSMLDMEYLNYIAEINGIDSSNRKILKDIVDSNRVFQNFKAAGYTIININSNSSWFQNMKLADIKVCGSYGSFANQELIIMLARTSVLEPIYAKFFGLVERDQILCQFEEISKIRQQVEGPIFVFAHFTLPHPPNIFESNGEPRDTREIDFESWSDKEGYIGQIQFANTMMLQTIDKIKNNSDNPPIIIIHADHGPFHGVRDDRADEDMLKVRAGILNAYYLPDSLVKPNETITPVNTYRLIFNTYFNGTYDYLDDRTFFSSYDRPYDLEDITNILTDSQ